MLKPPNKLLTLLATLALAFVCAGCERAPRDSAADSARSNTRPAESQPAFALLWTAALPQPVPHAPAQSDGIAIFADAAGTLHALDLATGKPLWTYRAEAAPSAAPSAAPTLALLATDDAQLHALDLRTGEPLWIFHTGRPITAPPLVHRDKIFLITGESEIIALSLGGEPLWSHSLPDAVRGGLAFHPHNQGLLLIAGCDAALTALDPDTGLPRLSINIDHQTGSTPLALADPPAAAVATFDARLLLISIPDGHLIWSRQPAEQVGQTYASPVAAADVLLLAPRQRLEAFSLRDGTSLWHFDARGEIVAPPAVTGPTAVLADRTGRLYALDISTGREIFQFRAAGPLSPPLTVEKNCILVVDAAGVVYLLQPHAD